MMWLAYIFLRIYVVSIHMHPGRLLQYSPIISEITYVSFPNYQDFSIPWLSQ
uniref:Uncharacterized protein n=1 Tax=Arundo donax TaxID=35708 RepID=A0A0A9G7L3_ARUDO